MRTLLKMGLFLAPAMALAASKIDPADRACKIDSDCQVIFLACACLHNSTCLRSDDKAKGIVDAVNKASADKYKPLSKCTKQEQDGCARAGACPMTGQWLAPCQKGECSLVFKKASF